MIELSVGELAAWVNRFLWPLFRIGAFLMVVPMIGTQLVPVRVRLLFALALTVVVAPLLPPPPVIDGLSPQLVLIVAQQLLVGLLLGFFVQLFFHVFVLGGQMIASQMGLGFASISDPANGVSVVVLSQFYLMLTMLLFLAMNGHLVLIQVIVQSFEVVPLDASLDPSSLWRVVAAGSWMFAAALVLALPAVIALLVVNFAFGIMTKAAPQLNIFAIGFPFTMVFGLFITWVGLSDFIGQYQRIVTEALDMLTHLLTVRS